jgi:hypothetical protein
MGLPAELAQLELDGFSSAHLGVFERCAAASPVVAGAPYKDARALLLCLVEAARAARLRVEKERAAG